MTTEHATGWIDRPGEVTAYLTERERMGDPCRIGGPFTALPDLAGYWQRLVMSGVYRVLPYQAEYEMLGDYAPADFQTDGNCVARGTYRAVQTSYWSDLAERRETGKPERLSYEFFYIGSRINIGGGQLGRSPGSVGAWAAKLANNIGVIPRRKYDCIDLTKDQEQWATRMAAPGGGLPQELIDAAKDHKCDAYHVADGHDLADVTAANYCSAMCSRHKQSDRRDENGECSYVGQTAHCEAIVGVYLRRSWDGNPDTIYQHTGFVDQQSWGNIPSGPDVLRFYKGDAKLRQGAYGTTMRDVQARIRTGETWAFKLNNGWRAGSLRETLQ